MINRTELEEIVMRSGPYTLEEAQRIVDLIIRLKAEGRLQ